MNSNQWWKRDTLPADSLDAIDAYKQAGRGQLIQIARRKVRTPWISDAMTTPANVHVLGHFGLRIPGVTSIDEWPSITLRVNRPADPRRGLKERVGVVAVYWTPPGAWVVVERPWDQVPWSMYRGDRLGPPGMLNGDKPEAAPATAGAVPQPLAPSGPGTGI